MSLSASACTVVWYVDARTKKRTQHMHQRPLHMVKTEDLDEASTRHDQQPNDEDTQDEAHARDEAQQSDDCTSPAST